MQSLISFNVTAWSLPVRSHLTIDDRTDTTESSADGMEGDPCMKVFHDQGYRGLSVYVEHACSIILRAYVVAASVHKRQTAELVSPV